MKNKLIAIFFWSVFSNVPVFSQGWQHNFGGSGQELGTSVIQTSDGGYITAGYTSGYGAPGNNVHVIKTDSMGKMQWQQVTGTTGNQEGYAIVQNTSGEYYIAGQTTGAGAGGIDVFVVKLGSSGNVIWTNTYGGVQDDYARSMIITAANDLVIAGTTKSTGAGGSDAYLLKVNPAGTLVWSKTFGKTGNENILSVSKVHDGGFLLAGNTNSFASNYGYIVRTNSNGDSLWTKAISIGSSSSNSLAGCTELSSNTQFAFVGYGNATGYNHLITILTDLNGVVTSTVTSPLLADGGYGITSTSDGGFATVSYYCNFGCRTVLSKFNAAGTRLWNKYYLRGSGQSYVTFSYANSLQQTADEGYIMAGVTYLPGVDADVALIKVEPDGTIPNDHITTPVASGPVDFCIGGSVQLTVPAGFDNYQWLYYSGNNLTWLPASDTTTITATAGGSYQCVMTNADGIYFSYTKQVNVTSPPVATITPTGAVSFCGPVQNITLTAPAGTGNSYVWKLNGSIISGAANNIYSPVAAGSYSVTITNNCGTSTSSPLVINNTYVPNIVINTNFLYISSVNGITCEIPTLSVSSNGSTFQWFFNRTPNGAANNSIYAYTPGNYYVIATNSCGSDTSNTVTIYSSNYVLALSPSANTNGCGQLPVTLYAPMSYDGTYTWYFNGNVIAGAITDNYQALANGFYTCDITMFCNNTLMTFSVTEQINLTGTPYPSISASGPTTSCSGSVTLTASPAGATYSWQKDNVAIPGANSITYNATLTGNYRCIVGITGCGSLYSNTIFVKFGAPAGTISGNLNICDGNNTYLSLSSTDNSSSFTSLQWRKNGITIVGANSTSYQATQSGSYDLVIANLCSTITTNALSVNVNVINNTVTPSGNLTLCPGGTITLVAAQGAGYTYSWYKNNTVISGATNDSLLVTQYGTYQVRIYSGSCNKMSPGVFIASAVLPAVNIWSNIPPDFCNGGSIVLNANTANGNTYSWTLNNNIIPGAVASSYTAATGGIYKVTITDSIGCTSVSPEFNVGSSGIANVSINAFGPVTFCGNGSVVLNSTVTGSSYQWFNGITPIPGATSLSYTADSTGLFFVQVTNAQGCTGSASIAVSEYPSVTITPVIINPDCGLSNGSISISLSGQTFPINYLWSTGAITSSVSSLLQGAYTVTIVDGTGCTMSATYNLVQAVPAAQISASTPTTFCAGGSVVLNANTGAGLTYQWKKYGNIIVGATSSNYTATTTGKYKVVVTNSAGCSATSAQEIITVNPLPAASITAGSATTFCPGSSVLLTANSGTGFTYAWKKGSNIISGATASTYLANSAGNFKAIVTNANGCSKTSNAITVTILPAPTAVITAGGPTSFCAGDSVVLTANSGAGLTRQWKRGSTVLAGATGISYTAKVAGNYKCTVTGTNGCTKNSNVISVTVPCRIAMQENSTLSGIIVYPNPSDGDITITISDENIHEILIYDELGKIIYTLQTKGLHNSYNLNSLNEGIYFIKTDNGITSRFIIL